MSFVLKRRVNYKVGYRASLLSFPAIFTDSGLLLSHLRFLYNSRAKSPSWIERNTFAVELLLKFIEKQIVSFSTATALLRAFVEALQFGTIQDGKDSSGLFWSPRSNEDVNVLLHHITEYCDYLDTIHGIGLPKLNPLRKATHAEECMQWCAYYRRHSRSFLNHLTKPSTQQFSLARVIRGPERHFVDVEEVYRFPEDRIEDLLLHGFVSASGEPDYASQLIVMLMHFGGLRLSECFHIYTGDISIDPQSGSALISVFHPSDGKSPDNRFSKRSEYLAHKYQLNPRNEYPRSHRLYAGWKGPLLTNRNLSFDVMFYPASKAVEFTLLLQKYLSTRPDSESPFLFLNSKVKPESKKNFIQKYKRAIRRIGLESMKMLGTTPHAHRHSYGYRLSQNSFSQLDIQKAMHHKSPDSCLVYLKPTHEDVRARMRGLLNEA
ncbi:MULTISPECIES: gamma-mobile-trio recombinase GmtY [Vibrio]|uniref:gamma-mobile-trio recombinase GmtY n=1 Tax=Vibrio TaxID=662 RepID=UPI001559C042|nr:MULTISPECIES: gamma-mobile-trio recombinase GmtY [Vibrio]MDE1239293.1 site-specific integrase [Vibrio aestuarianus]MDE1309561.1 site-specific integrase [Vibrio aestuarianus]MDE1337293.1 site-specific integrase [Vibrio aestuarianus]MDF9401019.1 site-specific integrase [Vibrio sp. 1180_3]NGZ16388.1 site-specific integrase [Vibrio aestuarianus]